MTTQFALLLARCGLSRQEAAAFLSARPDTIRSWCDDRRRAPAGVIQQLRDLYHSIEQAADEAVAQFQKLLKKHGAPEMIELGLASDDHEAQQLGLPCVGAHRALLGIVAARLDVDVVIVPRGATPATAKAADARDKTQ